jgi:hypothetical protein
LQTTEGTTNKETAMKRSEIRYITKLIGRWTNIMDARNKAEKLFDDGKITEIEYKYIRMYLNN